MPLFARSPRHPSRRLGASAVEFALVAPVFFLVVLGIIEFGRMVMVQQVITNASREGARIAVLDSATTERVTTRVKDYLAAAGLSAGSIVLSPSPPTLAQFDEPVSVEVSIPVSAVSALSKSFMTEGMTLTARSVMRRETAE